MSSAEWTLIETLRDVSEKHKARAEAAEASLAALRQLVEKWRERGKKLEPTRHKAIRRGDGGAADVYDAEQRALFACADDVAIVLGEGPQQ